MFQLLLKTGSSGHLWSCVIVRPVPPTINRLEPPTRDELIDILIDALDEGVDPLRSLVVEGCDFGVLFEAQADVYCVYMETLTNVFTPLALLPLDDAVLVADEMRESVKDRGGDIQIRKLSDDVNYKRLAYALAAERLMPKWW